MALLNAIDKTVPKIEVSPYGTALENEVLIYWTDHCIESGETLREKTRIFFCHVDISIHKNRCLNMANPKNSYSTLPKSENLRVFVETDDRRRIQPIGSPGETILGVRAQILKSFVFLTRNSGFFLVEADLPGQSLACLLSYRGPANISS